MLSRIIYCTAVVLATAAVILLALFSPLPHRQHRTAPRLTLSLTLYIQQPQPGGPAVAPPTAGALTFHRTLTDSASGVVGKAQGFIIPGEGFAESAFSIIYLTVHTEEYSGSISVRARNMAKWHKEEMRVVGGTGAFAFARGVAVFRHASASHCIQLHLELPDRTSTVTT